MRCISLYTLHPSPKTSSTYASKHSHSIAPCSRARFNAVKVVMMNRKKVVFQAGRNGRGKDGSRVSRATNSTGLIVEISTEDLRRSIP